MFISVVSVICLILLIYYIKSFFNLKKKNTELKDIVSRDKLTGAYNEADFKKEAAGIVAHNQDKKFAVLYIDIENFKYINDVFGYAYGDEVLKTYASFMLKDTRENEAFGRSVADRFTALRCYEEKEELLARLRASLRRAMYQSSGGVEDNAVFENGDLKIDYASGCVFIRDEEIHLTPIEYKLLCLLAKNVGRVLTHNFILNEVWGNVMQSDVPSLRVFMATLRKKIEEEPSEPRYIQTHIGIGYRMIKRE